MHATLAKTAAAPARAGALRGVTRVVLACVALAAPAWVAPGAAGLATVTLAATTLALSGVGARPAHAVTAAEADRARRTRAAEALATEAKALFRNKAFAASARQFMEAYATIKRAALVYNAARAREEQGALKRAESLFLMYLDLRDASAPGKADARKHLASIRARLAAQATAPRRPARPPAEPATAPGTQPAAGVRSDVHVGAPAWPLWLSGGLLMAAGATYGVAVATSPGADLSGVTSPSLAEGYRSDRDRSRTLRGVAVALGVGAAGLGAWALWQRLRAPSTSPRPAAAWAPFIGRRTSGVLVRF